MKKVYFAIYDMGGGHRSTANALKAVIESRGLPWQVEIVEVLKDVCGTTFSQDFYNRWILKQKWAKLINDPISVPIFKARIRLMHKRWLLQLATYWRKEQPDMVVSLMPLLNRVLQESLQYSLPLTPFVTSVTDFADCPPHFWIESPRAKQPQFMICPSQRVWQQAQAAGYGAESLFCTSGVVIHPRYRELAAIDPSARRRRLGLRADLPTGLVCFGAHGSKDMVEIAKRLDGKKLQLIFVCGRNEALAERLRRLDTHYPKHVEGFTRELPTFMRASDFFIGKPGSVGVSEAIAQGLPVITECNRVTTLLQERATADWLREQSLGLVVNDFTQVATAVDALLSPGVLESYQRRVESYDNKAAFEVVDILSAVLNSPQAVGSSVSSKRLATV